MLAYAASRPQIAGRRSSPNAMLAIIGAHVAVVAIVMSTKMDLPLAGKGPPIDVYWLPKPTEPPPPKPAIEPPAPQPLQGLTTPEPLIPLPVPDPDATDPVPPIPNPGPIVGPTPQPGPAVNPIPAPMLEKAAARLLTSAYEIRPPYPASKLASGEEALLRLRLTIDEVGSSRVDLQACKLEYSIVSPK